MNRNKRQTRQPEKQIYRDEDSHLQPLLWHPARYEQEDFESYKERRKEEKRLKKLKSLPILFWVSKKSGNFDTLSSTYVRGKV